MLCKTIIIREMVSIQMGTIGAITKRNIHCTYQVRTHTAPYTHRIDICENLFLSAYPSIVCARMYREVAVVCLHACLKFFVPN